MGLALKELHTIKRQGNTFICYKTFVIILRRIQARRQSARQESRKLSSWKEFQLVVAMVMIFIKFLLIDAMESKNNLFLI